MFRPTILVTLLAGLIAARAAEPHPSLPPPVIPDCLGVNIHFTDPQPGELEMLAAAGFKWVRMDFGWGGTERKKGEYEFSAYDRLVAALDKFQIRAVFILDYGNPLYAAPGDTSPFTTRANTPEFREAFGKWAVAAVQHFKGRGYLWEMWNEPNGGFWKSPDKTGDYIALAKTTGAALRQAGLLGPKGEAFIGPATSTIDLPYLEACFKAGLLDYWDAVSVHPYRQGAPETVEEEYRSVRLLIRKYAPKDKVIPIVSGEWGYSSAWPGMGKDEAARIEQQGKYLPRQFLTNIANDVALSIWYDWHEDGTDPKEAEHHFGIVGHEYHAGRNPVYDPKPAYTAMKRLTGYLQGMRFNKRLVVNQVNAAGQECTQALLFAKKDVEALAVWQLDTVDGDFEEDAVMSLPLVSQGAADILPLSASHSPMKVCIRANEFCLRTDKVGVAIVQPENRNEFLQLAAASPRLPLDFVYRWPSEKPLPISPSAEPAGLTNHSAFSSSSSGFVDQQHGVVWSVTNPLKHSVQVGFGVSSAVLPELLISAGESMGWRSIVEDSHRKAQSHHTEGTWIRIGGAPFFYEQATTLICLNPLTIEAYPPASNALPVRISNPSGEPAIGIVEVIIKVWPEKKSEPIVIPLKIAEGEA